MYVCTYVNIRERQINVGKNIKSVYVREKAQQMSQVTDYTTLYKDKIRFSS